MRVRVRVRVRGRVRVRVRVRVECACEAVASALLMWRSWIHCAVSIASVTRETTTSSLSRGSCVDAGTRQSSAEHATSSWLRKFPVHWKRSTSKPPEVPESVRSRRSTSSPLSCNSSLRTSSSLVQATKAWGGVK